MLYYLTVFIKFLFPELCLHCKKRHVLRNNPLCNQCVKELQFTDNNKTNICHYCFGTIKYSICQKCNLKTNYNSHTSLLKYNDVGRSLLIAAKKLNRTWAIKFLLNKLAFIHEDIFCSYDALIFLPSSSNLNNSIVQYLKKTGAKNIITAFTINKKVPKSKDHNLEKRYQLAIKKLNFEPSSELMNLIKTSKVLVVDDVFTTGATLEFACRKLIDFGFAQQKIDAFTLFQREKLNYFSD